MMTNICKTCPMDVIFSDDDITIYLCKTCGTIAWYGDIDKQILIFRDGGIVTNDYPDE